MKLLKRIILKFKNAFDGINIGLFNDRSIQIQFIFMLMAIFMAWFYKVTTNEWLMIIIVSTLVVAVEFLNSAIELLSDYVTDKKYSDTIKKVKDLGAAAVLIVALSALLVGIIIFKKYIF